VPEVRFGSSEQGGFGLGAASPAAGEVAQMGGDQGESSEGGDDAGEREVKLEVSVGIFAQRGAA
jgi:hypothetical protein